MSSAPSPRSPSPAILACGTRVVLSPWRRQTEGRELGLQFRAFATAGKAAVLPPCEQAVFLGRPHRSRGVVEVQQPDHGGFDAGEVDGVPLIVEEGFPDEGDPFRDDLVADGGRVTADFMLRAWFKLQELCMVEPVMKKLGCEKS